MLDSLTRRGFIHVWSFVNGLPACEVDAIPPTHPDAAQALGRHAKIEQLDAEAAIIVAAHGVPEPTPVEDEEAETDDTRAARALAEDAFEQAQTLIANTPPVVEALARQRLGDEMEGDQALIDAEVAAAEPIAPVLPVPIAISDRQFFHAAAKLGIVTQEEALAAASIGTIPPILEQIISQLPDGPQFDARIMIASAVTYERNNPLVEAVRQSLGWTHEQVNDLFRLAASL